MVRGVYYARYWLNGVEKRKSLGTSAIKSAKAAQKEFYVGKEVYKGKSIQDKLKSNPDLYIYQRPPYVFQIAGKIAVPCNTREEAEKERDKYLARPR